jgi:ABC-type amino acid transport substrate-binding protein
MKVFRFKALFQILLALLSFTQMNSQNSNLTTPICYDNGTVTYSLEANISDYLLNNNNLDKRTFFDSPTDLKDKIVGSLPGFPINTNDYKDVIFYPTTEDLIKAVRNHSVDGLVVDKGTNDYIILHNYDLYQFPEKVGTVQYGPIFQKDSTYQEVFDQFASENNIPHILETWSGINYDAQKVDKKLDGNNGTIKAIAYLGNRPYAYMDDNGEPTGSCLDIIYSFAKYAGYKVDFQNASSYNDEISAIKQKNADISCAYITDSLKNDVSTGYTFEQDINTIIRLSNSNTSNQNKNKKFYETYRDLDGENLGVLTDSSFEEITKRNFSHSTYKRYNNSFQLYKAMFKGEIEGFLTDLPSAEDYQMRFPEKVSYFEENFHDNIYGFAFHPNNSKLRTDFNNYLYSKDLMAEYPKWNIKDTSNLTVDKTVNTSAPKIRVSMFPDTKPVCFEQNNEITGYEILLLYEFARQQNYNIELIILENSSDRINYILQNKSDISGGALAITEEREKLVKFSFGTLLAGTSLVIPKERRKLPGKIGAFNEHYEPKENNTINYPVKVGDIETVSSCVFPESYPYNEYILINCTISDLKGANPNLNGLELGNSNDKIALDNVEYNPTNLLNGNTLLPGRNIIRESNKTEYICEGEAPTTLPATTIPTTVITTTLSIKNSSIYYKSSNGLSSGAMIAIIIPCAVVLVGAAIAGFLYRRVLSIPAPVYAQRLDTSVYKFNVISKNPNQNTQVHQVPIQQVVPFQQITQVEQVVPITQVKQVVTDPAAVVVNNP